MMRDERAFRWILGVVGYFVWNCRLESSYLIDKKMAQ